MKVKLNDVQKAIQAIAQIDKLEEQLYNAKLYMDVDTEKEAKKDLVVAYKFAVDELRYLINNF